MTVKKNLTRWTASISIVHQQNQKQQFLGVDEKNNSE